MNPFRPRLADLPEEFPVFPLTGALLLPAGRLPLNIFEPRYLAMVDDAMGLGRMFGMIQPDPARPHGESKSGLYRVGCLGRLSSFSETEDGRYLITLTGVARFTVTQELAKHRGYRRVRGDFSRFADDLADPETVIPAFDRPILLRALRAYFTHRGFDANWEAIEAMPNNTLVVTLCMVCPFEPAAKQALLEAQTATDRAQALLALLQIDAHGAADDDKPISGHSRAS